MIGPNPINPLAKKLVKRKLALNGSRGSTPGCTKKFGANPDKTFTAIHAALYVDELKAREKFIKRVPTWTRPELRKYLENCGYTGTESIDSWLGDGIIFSVKHQRKEYFPQFQFAEGRPLKVVARILKVMKNKRKPWEIAHWCVAPNGWLDDDRPIDVLEDEAARDVLLDAAKQEVLPNVG